MNLRSRRCFGDIHVNLDSSSPSWNDGMEESLLKLIEVPPSVFSNDEYV